LAECFEVTTLGKGGNGALGAVLGGVVGGYLQESR
jgi:hypothetical protein